MRMRAKLFVSFAVFTLTAILLLWGFQILLLDRFYYEVTKRRMMSAANEITELYAEDSEDFDGDVYGIGLNNELCISVFDGEGRLTTTADIGGGCLIHNISDNALTKLYQRAQSQGGEYFHRAGLAGFQNGETRPFFSGGDYHVRDRLLYATVRDTTRGTLILLFDSAITPVNMIKGALMLQLMLVTLTITVIASFVANSLAKRLSRPITDVNRAAKQLTAGVYDVQFDGDGYREIVELSDTLNRTAEELARTDKMQKELIANISHDLRTPLTMITGYCEMMRDIEGENTPENMQVVLDETARLTSLVNDLVDLSKYQSGAEPKVEIEHLDLDALLVEVIDRYRKLMAGKGYTFVYESVGQRFADCDKKRILQVIYNLINNAINYAGDDKTVLVRLCDTADGRARVEVIDHGEGIDKENLPYIFDRYYKVDKVHKRAVTGTGLGLSIVKNILTAQGAPFGVTSEVGKGSTFYFEL